MTDERFLVTGSLGCVGAWTVRALVRAGIPVFAQFGITPQTALRYGIPYGAQSAPGAQAPAEMTATLVEQAKLLEDAGASLLDTRAEIKAQLGQPLRIIHGTNEFGSFTRFHYHRLNVQFLGNSGALSIDTTRPREKTDRGIGVTSTTSELKAAYPAVACQRVGFHSRLCVLGNQQVGRRVTVFRIHDGIITRVEVEFVVD